ncbi:MAG TPA: ATP-binding protein [Streptosporangiaceae bacterium]|jgi:signal transduction histidine kinase|nr:ATP-binding protein [Streptosporangiaceae bacterium]
MTDLNTDLKDNPADSAPGGTGTRPVRSNRSDRAAARAASARRWPLSRIIGVALLILLLFSVAAMVAGGLALLSLHNARQRVVGTLSPAALQVQRLDTALVDQETGVRGFALSGQKDFLAPYYQGVTDERSAISALQAVIGQLPPSAAADLKSVTAQARAWRAHYAQPTISQVSQTGKPATSSPAILAGKADFDALRARIDTLQARISAARTQAVAALNDSAAVLDGVFIAVAAGLAAIVVLLAVGLRATVIRPLHRLAAEARQVADGDFGHEVSLAGPREVTDLAVDVNTMRERILDELAATRQANTVLQEHTEELERSNSELEQFAYIASHDLQEPLRKVASFTQLLQRRYAGQLDARADQYIEFAVDGAKRMQALINDLLQYSRVGRSAREPSLVSSDAALAQARNNLAAAMEETGATVETGHLPLVLAELPLLTAVFQNLLSNALKFSGGKPPRIVITCTRDEPFWLFSFADNGIGIEPEYAERIFVIFQRLHERTAYPGTGIGLAMTRKIIEYFGGRIWLDTSYTDGSRFLFTLPMPAEAMDPPAEDETPEDETPEDETAKEADD